MANNRVFYAAKKAGIAPLGSNSYTTLRGLQSIGLTTSFNLEQVFKIGQLAIYENVGGLDSNPYDAHIHNKEAVAKFAKVANALAIAA